nr:winged helix-turn-helix domain-containing protein [uncultured Bacteroides sp.]
MNVPWLMQIKVDKSAQKAIYVQIVDEIIKSIKSGQLKAGVTLPGTRQLAIELGVNRNTIIQALDILKLKSSWCEALSSLQHKGS